MPDLRIGGRLQQRRVRREWVQRIQPDGRMSLWPVMLERKLLSNESADRRPVLRCGRCLWERVLHVITGVREQRLADSLRDEMHYELGLRGHRSVLLRAHRQ